MNKIAAELIRNLDQMASEGRLLKRYEECLKGGIGKCMVYTDTVLSKKEGYDSGNIVMRRGATIGEHAHPEDEETYTVIAGKVRSGSKVYYPGDTMTCRKGDSHSCVNLADGESVLRFVKRK